MTCLHCNGWGVVYRIQNKPPLTVEARMTARVKDGPTYFQLKEQVCKACLGYGFCKKEE